MRRCCLAVMLWMGVGVSVLPAATLEDLAQRVQRGDNSAMAELDTILQHEPQNYPARFLQARLFSQQGHSDAAIKAYRQLIQQQPLQPEAYNNLAGLLARQGDLSGAQQLLEQALNTNPSYATVYQNLSTIYVEQARTSYGKALRLEQNNPALTLTELNQLATKQPVESATVTTLAVVPPPPPVAVAPPAKANSKTDVAVPTTTSANVAQALPSAPAVASVSLPQPTPAVTPARPEIDQQQLITTLQGWAAAWSGKAPEMYLSFYDKGFSPPGISRINWEAQRRQRLTEPQWIKVDLSEFNIKPLNSQRARVRFVQEYQSDGYRDRIRKELVLQYTVDGWRIIAERNIAALH